MPSYMRSGCQQPDGRTGSGLIVLDESGSILHPAAGARQRFCYRVYAADDQGTSYAPLEYVILGLGANISQNDFYAVSVSVNGVMQNVVWGQNAWIVNDADPDGNTGCTGLKLAFPLSNATDVMGVCLTMQRIYTVGMLGSCLYADGASFTGIALPAPQQAESEACPATAYQEVDVCVPVTITPYATVGNATVTCCGAPTVTQGNGTCEGVVGGQCSFTVSQRMCVALPVTFGANTQAGEYTVACGNAGEGSCENCNPDNAAVSAVRSAVERGMIRMQNAIAVQSTAKIAQPAVRGCSRCQARMNQTRIQDLVRDPMIWRD